MLSNVGKERVLKSLWLGLAMAFLPTGLHWFCRAFLHVNPR